MKPSVAFAAVFAVSLSACGERPSPDPSAADSAHVAAPLEADPAAPPPLEAPAPGAGAATPPADSGVIRFDGFGPAAFGSDQEQVRMAWGRDLGDAQPAEPGGCYYLVPQPLEATGYAIAFMIEGDRFVRLDVRSDAYTAPGGGQVGMLRTDLERLYPDRIEAMPHKYVEGAQTLRVAEGDRALVFETDVAGRVTEWRIGTPPQVDYVEGCG